MILAGVVFTNGGLKAMTSIEQKLKAAGALKDWSNYMLVTTVAALGWVARDAVAGTAASSVLLHWEVRLLAASVAFGIFTLALIPIIMERIEQETPSIYEVKAPFKLFWMWGREYSIRVKWVCWPQHVLFLLAIILHAARTL